MGFKSNYYVCDNDNKPNDLEKLSLLKDEIIKKFDLDKRL